jgi:hypothetical protein
MVEFNSFVVVRFVVKYELKNEDGVVSLSKTQQRTEFLAHLQSWRQSQLSMGLSGLNLGRPKLRVSKVAVCCFSWGICYDFYGVKSAAGG